MKVTTKDMVYIALFTSIMIVCAFITIPFAIPFTLQTFALFTIIGILGTKRAFISVLLYLLLGAVGLPVFSGFRGGIGHLFGATGGYLLGFLLTTLISGFLMKFFSKKKKKQCAFSLLFHVNRFNCLLHFWNNLVSSLIHKQHRKHFNCLRAVIMRISFCFT